MGGSNSRICVPMPLIKCALVVCAHILSLQEVPPAATLTVPTPPAADSQALGRTESASCLRRHCPQQPPHPAARRADKPPGHAIDRRTLRRCHRLWRRRCGHLARLDAARRAVRRHRALRGALAAFVLQLARQSLPLAVVLWLSCTARCCLTRCGKMSVQMVSTKMSTERPEVCLPPPSHRRRRL